MWCDITKAIDFYIATDMAPISTVELLKKTLNLQYELPTRNKFAKEVQPKMYTDARASLGTQLAKVSHYALTCGGLRNKSACLQARYKIM